MLTGIDRASMKKGEFDLILRFDNQYQRTCFERMLEDIRKKYNDRTDVTVTVSNKDGEITFSFIKAIK